MKALITDKAYNWANHAKYDERAVLQDLTNDLRRYQATHHPEDLPATNLDKDLALQEATLSKSQTLGGNTPEATMHPAMPADTQDRHTGNESMDAGATLPMLRNSQNGTRPVNHSACPTLWGYSRQQAISKATAPSMANARLKAKKLQRRTINDIPASVAPTCVDCGTFFNSDASKPGTEKGRKTKDPNAPSDFVLKRGYIYVPPQIQGSTAPKPIYAKAMLSQTSYIPAADTSAETLWRKQWDVSSHQNDYTLNRKATTGVGPLAPVYWSKTDSGAKFTVTYGNKISEMPEGSAQQTDLSGTKLVYVPRDMPNAPKSAALTAPIGQMFPKTDSLRWGLTGGKPYLRNITDDDLAKTMLMEKELKYDDRTTHRKSYVPMSDMAKDAAANDHAECVRLWHEQYTKPSPVPKGVPLPMETTQQAANRITTMNNELIQQREEASLRKRLQEEAAVVYKPSYAGEWAKELPGRRMNQLDVVIQSVKLDPDQENAN